MSREELIKKLENVAVPEITVEGHRERLRFVLLNTQSSDHLMQKLPAGNSIGDRLKSWLNSLREPVWKVALVGTSATFVLGAVTAVCMFLATPSPAVVAADIVKNDPGIQQRLSGNGEIIIIRVDVKNQKANVVCGRGAGDFLEAEVDLDVRVVVNSKRYEGIFVAELPQEAQIDAVNIARSDARVKSIIDEGGKIVRIFPAFSGISTVSVVNGNLIKVTPTSDIAIIYIVQNGKIWLVQVNLSEKKTERIMEPQFKKYYNDHCLMAKI